MKKNYWSNDLCKLLGCTYPVLLAGMGGVSRHKLAIAVAKAGGFATLGMVRESPDFISDEVSRFRQSCDKPFAVNLIPRATDTELLHRQIDTCINLQVPVISLFWDIDTGLVDYLKKKGLIVIYQVGSENEANEAIDAGVDVLIVQGIEAGGHIRGSSSTITLVKEISSFSRIPVVAAGGIATGEDFLRMLKAGALGVSCGTAFLATNESNAHNSHKQKIIESNERDTIITTAFWKNWHKAEPTRVIKPRHIEEMPDVKKSNTVIAFQDNKPVHLFSTDSPLKGAEGKIELMPYYAGKSCTRITGLASAKTRLISMIQEVEAIINESIVEANVSKLYSSPCYMKDFN